MFNKSAKRAFYFSTFSYIGKGEARLDRVAKKKSKTIVLFRHQKLKLRIMVEKARGTLKSVSVSRSKMSIDSGTKQSISIDEAAVAVAYKMVGLLGTFWQ